MNGWTEKERISHKFLFISLLAHHYVGYTYTRLTSFTNAMHMFYTHICRWWRLLLFVAGAYPRAKLIQMLALFFYGLFHYLPVSTGPLINISPLKKKNAKFHAVKFKWIFRILIIIIISTIVRHPIAISYFNDWVINTRIHVTARSIFFSRVFFLRHLSLLHKINILLFPIRKIHSLHSLLYAQFACGKPNQIFISQWMQSTKKGVVIQPILALKLDNLMKHYLRFV